MHLLSRPRRRTALRPARPTTVVCWRLITTVPTCLALAERRKNSVAARWRHHQRLVFKLDFGWLFNIA
jgi:hypothetical protein